MNLTSLLPLDCVHHLGQQRPPLVPGEVHLWLVDLDAGRRATSALMAVLSHEERATVHRLEGKALKCRYVLAHGGLRCVLSFYLDMPPAEIRMIRSPTGKPFLDPRVHRQIFFNLSHCKDLALIAITEEGEVGVDIEQRRPIPEMVDIARAYFTPAEHQQVAAAPVGRREALFFQLWTRKEALVKLGGTGLGAPLQTRPDRLNETIDVPPLGDFGASGCSTLSFRPRPDSFAAAAVRHPKAAWVMLPSGAGRTDSEFLRS